MNNSINILILSCGTRNKIVQYFKKELAGKGQVIGADCSELAPALYDVDKYFVVPRVDDENYLDIILDICKENNIKGVLSLIDPELSILSKNIDKFLLLGTIPIISECEIIEKCLNKYNFYELLIKNGINTITSYIDKEEFYHDVELGVIEYPVFVKPVEGSASINSNKVYSKDEIEILFNQFDNLMIQKFMNGIEYGVDCYVDMITGETIVIFTKEKINMRDGETDKSVSIRDEKLFEIVNKILKIDGFKGVIDIDIFKVNNEYYISEINPRFGGGYLHAYECGINIPKMIINNIENIKNDVIADSYKENIYMMKYSEVTIIKVEAK